MVEEERFRFMSLELVWGPKYANVPMSGSGAPYARGREPNEPRHSGKTRAIASGHSQNLQDDHHDDHCTDDIDD